MRNLIIGLCLAFLVPACTEPNTHRECERTADCPAELVCRFDNCVSPDGVSDDGCPQGQIRCDGACVDHLTDVAFCGGCGGCEDRVGAEAVVCADGRCGYQCTTGFRDGDDDLESLVSNGCECPASGGDEVCDGLDNDCDGFIDEDCVTCDETGDEVCDGLDNDCDGEVDEGLRPELTCPGVNGAVAVRCGELSCAYECIDGRIDKNGDLDTTDGDGCECVPAPEVCDGLDNDCDGLTDLADADFGLTDCPQQVRARVSDCFMGACLYECLGDAVDLNGDLQTDGDGCECLPTGPEVCDGVDNDCDGTIDGADDSFTGLCPVQEGVCEGADTLCSEGQLLACTDAIYASFSDGYQSGPETFCDGADNDCDGAVDEHCCDDGFLRDGWGAGRPDDAVTHVAAASGPGTNLVVTINGALQILARVYDDDGAQLGEEVVLRTGLRNMQLAAAWAGDRYLVVWGTVGGMVLHVHGVSPEGERASPADGIVPLEHAHGESLFGGLHAGGVPTGIVVARSVEIDDDERFLQAIALRPGGQLIGTLVHVASETEFFFPTAVVGRGQGAVVSGISIQDVDGPNRQANFVWGVDVADILAESAFHSLGETEQNLGAFGGLVVQGPEGLVHVGLYPDVGVPQAQLGLTSIGADLTLGLTRSVFAVHTDGAYLFGASLDGAGLVVGMVRGERIFEGQAERLEVTAINPETGDLLAQERYFVNEELTTLPVGTKGGLGFLSVVGMRGAGEGVEPRPIQWWTSTQGVPLCPVE
jgi:hypothetical protein